MAKSSISKDSFFNVSGNPNLDAADTGVDPSTGRILTKKERIAIFKKRKINANKVFGKTDPKLSKVGKITKPLAKFGAIVKSDDGVKGSSSDKEGKGGSSGVQPQNKLIEGLSKQISNNSRKITILKNIVKSNIEKVSKILKGDAEKEKKEQREDQRQTQLNDEKDKKKKKEGLLEGVGKSVGKSLLKPVEAVGKSVKGILGRLGDAFMALFMGFVANKGIKMFQAMLSGDTETFKKMRNQIIGAVAIAGGIFLALNGGLLALPGIISGVASAVIPVIGAILGFLASPAGLIALGIAAGIGTVFAIKALIDKSRGGKEANAERDEINQELKDAGVKKTRSLRSLGFSAGYDVMRDGKKTFVKYDQLTDEERAAVDKNTENLKKVNDLNKKRKQDIKAAKKAIKEEREPERERLKEIAKITDDYTAHNAYKEETKRLRKQAEADINAEFKKNVAKIAGPEAAAKYDSLDTKTTGDGNNIKASNNIKNGINKLDEVEPDIKQVNNGGTGGTTTTNTGNATNNVKINSKNSDNSEVNFAQMQYNTGG